MLRNLKICNIAKTGKCVFFLTLLSVSFSCGHDSNEELINDVFFGNQVTSSKLPKVTTSAVSGINNSNAICGGNISSQGGSAVTMRGVCWNTSPSPTDSHSFTTNGTGTGVFTSNITGLASNTTYYVRAYATNSFGTAYGNELSFKSATYTATIPTNGLVARYPINGNVADISGNNLHGVPHSVYKTTDRFGNESSAARLSGISSSWIEIPHNALLNLGQSFSICVWVLKESGSENYVLGKGRDITCGTYTMSYSGFSANGSCGTSVSNPTEVPLNEWTLLTGVMDGATRKLRFYQNGKFIKEVNCTPFTSNNTYPLAIGRHVTSIPASDSDPWAYPFKGKIDDILIYNRALTSIEVMRIYSVTN